MYANFKFGSILRNRNSLMGETLINKKLPTRRRILQSAKNLSKDFIKNPIKTVREGIQNDRNANALYKGLTNRSGRKEVLKAIYKGGGKDLIVNTGGFAGSKIGAAIGGGITSKIGSLGGDWLGARITRRALNDTEAIIKANKIKSNPKFKQQSKNIQNNILRKRTIGYSKSINKKQSELANDTLGWGIGNASAETLQALGSKIPLQGGFTAMGTMNTTKKSINVGLRARRQALNRGSSNLEATGIGLRKGLLRNNRKLGQAIRPRNIINQGNIRENKMRNNINSHLQKLPNVPPNINLKQNKKLIHFNYCYT